MKLGRVKSSTVEDNIITYTLSTLKTVSKSRKLNTLLYLPSLLPGIIVNNVDAMKEFRVGDTEFWLLFS